LGKLRYSTSIVLHYFRSLLSLATKVGVRSKQASNNRAVDHLGSTLSRTHFSLLLLKNDRKKHTAMKEAAKIPAVAVSADEGGPDHYNNEDDDDKDDQTCFKHARTNDQYSKEDNVAVDEDVAVDDNDAEFNNGMAKYKNHNDEEAPVTNAVLMVATADEVTILMVDDVKNVPTAADLQEERVRATEQRAAAAEVERRAAERRLADHQRNLCQPMAELSMMQRGVVFGLILLVVVTTATALVICRSGKCSTTTTTTTTGPPTATLSPRAEFIVDFINNNTLTGQTILYPDDTTPEGRALLWLIDDDEQKAKNNGTFVVMDRDDDDEVSLQQRYALATLCFQSPTYFDSARPMSSNKTWATAVDECEWKGVVCHNSTGMVGSVQLEKEVFLHGGHIPDDLALLTALIILDLTSSRLVGTIPSSLAHLTALQEFVLQNNALTGTISS
jgi:hypothetical protein